jgi:predicted CoA-binding protein
MQDIAEMLRDPDVTIAVIGANNHPEKYGYVIYRDLKRKGFKLFPINPKTAEVDGDRSYARLSELPETPSIVDFVTPPPVTLKILVECLTLNLKNVWLQPGSESPEVMEFVQENNFNYLANACIMVESRFHH